ncbi:MAG: hypothetical protein R3B54_01155 [Bdellovibrionota bacterium]
MRPAGDYDVLGLGLRKDLLGHPPKSLVVTPMNPSFVPAEATKHHRFGNIRAEQGGALIEFERAQSARIDINGFALSSSRGDKTHDFGVQKPFSVILYDDSVALG